jgi:putative ABC transport system permease protein
MAAMMAVASAGVLVLGMCGLFIGLINGYTAPLDRSRADIMVLMPNTKTLFTNDSGLPARILPLVYLHPEVTEVRSLDGWGGTFYGTKKSDPIQVSVSIVDPIPDAVTLPRDFTEDVRQALTVPFNIAVDQTSLKRLGVEPGGTGTFNGRVLRVAAILHGYPNVDNPVIVMSRQTLRLLLPWRGEDRIGPLMVRVANPDRAKEVRDELNRMANGQYRAWTRKELRDASLNQFLNEGIIAVFMYAAVFLGLGVGIVITWQTLRGAVLANIKEFASLRALGVSMRSLRWIVLELSFWVGVVGLVFTAVLMTIITVLAQMGGMMLGYQIKWVIIVAVLLMVIAVASGFFSLGVLKKSQPADLLR